VNFTEPFSAWAGPRAPRLLLLGEAFGASEDLHKAPFVGASGKELVRMLGDAGVGAGREYDAMKSGLFDGDERFLTLRGEWLRACGLAMTNVFNLRPRENKLESLCAPEGNGLTFAGRTLGPLVRSPRHLYMAPAFLPHLARLQGEVRAARPNLVVALGAGALWGLGAALGQGGGALSDVRGTVHPGPPKHLPTYHPAGVLRQWSWRTIAVADLVKAWRESTTPEFTRPSRHVIINPELEDIHQWLTSLKSSPSKQVLSCDIETKAGQITSIGFAKSKEESIVIPFVVTGEGIFRNYWMTSHDEVSARRLVREILATPLPKLFQNGLYDIQWLLREGFAVRNVAEDTMLLHHAIHPEMRKGLGFLGSLYTNEPAWKLMRDRGKDEGEKAGE
jgi:uracil-DNA glycosylase